MKVRNLRALILALAVFGSGAASAQTNQGSSPLAIEDGGTNAVTAAAARTSLGVAIGSNVQAWDADLDCLAANSTAGLLARTGAGTCAARTLTAPAAGFTITNPAGTAGNPTFVLANDLGALEALASTGIAVRTATDTWAQRTITGTTNAICVTNGDGVSGNPTLDICAGFLSTAHTWAGQQTLASPIATGTLDIQQALLHSGDITPTQIVANTNDYAPTGFSTATVLRLSTDASRNITGLAGGADGRTLYLYNVGSFNIVLSFESASSTAANRFGFSADRTLSAGDGVTLIYDSTASRWRLVGSNPSTGGGGGGDASGPASSTDNALARFDGTTGKLIQNSEITLGDSDGKLSRTAGISVGGTNTNDNAAAGYVGELIESSVTSVSITTTVQANVTSISLTAGDWDVWANLGIGGTSTTVIRGSITTTSATLGSGPNGGAFYLQAGDQVGGFAPVGQKRLSLSTTTTVYLVTQSAGTGTLTANGYLGARRRR